MVTPDVGPIPSESNSSVSTSVWSTDPDDEGFNEVYDITLDDLFGYESDLEILSDEEGDVTERNVAITKTVERAFAGELPKSDNISEMVGTLQHWDF